jgi:membrane protease YdiL (CAAX protease family)
VLYSPVLAHNLTANQLFKHLALLLLPYCIFGAIALANVGKPLALTWGVMGAVALWLYVYGVRTYENREPNELSLHGQWTRCVLAFVGLFIFKLACLVFVNQSLGYAAWSLTVLPWPMERDAVYIDAYMLMWAILVAPFVEELLFRGVLMRYFASWMPAWMSLLLQALAFTLLHRFLLTPDPTGRFAQLFMLGLLLGLLFLKFGNIAICITAHMALNLSALFIAFFVPAEVIRGGDEALTAYATVALERSYQYQTGMLAVICAVLFMLRRNSQPVREANNREKQ